MSKLLVALSLAINLIAFAYSLANLDGRIVGGEQISIQKAPYLVSIQLNDKHVCGGSLIDDYWVLTATHCFYKTNTRTLKVRVGSTYWDEGGQLLDVMYIMSHDDYNDDWVTNDITLLKLSEKVKLSTHVQLIPLATEESSPGSRAYVSGWGQTSQTNKTYPKHLNGVEVALISREVCRNAYSADEIFDYNICTFTFDKDSCQGDSGGPLITNGKLNGIVSWAKGCAMKPAVYTSVPSFLDWIKKTMNDI